MINEEKISEYDGYSIYRVSNGKDDSYEIWQHGRKLMSCPTEADAVDWIKDDKKVDEKASKALLSVLNGVPVREAIMAVCDFVDHRSLKEKKVDIRELESAIKDAVSFYMQSEGFDANEVRQYSSVICEETEDGIRVEVGAEISLEGCFDLAEQLDKVVTEFDPDAYFDIECPGRLVAIVQV